MAIDTASVAARHPAALRSRIAAIPAWAWLVPLIAVSVGLRVLGALHRATPRYFPDEYIYSSLARSLAHGRLEIRGTPAHFPALLEPLLAAPLWLGDDVELSYRLTQSLHVVAASLAAVPVYVIARQLSLPPWQRLLCAALTLAAPALVYSSYLTADAVALPLALAAIAAGTSVLGAPTKRGQAWFVTFAALACFARVQYVAILAAFACGAVVMARGRPWIAARRFPVVTLLLAVPALGAIAAGPGRVLGYYDSIFDLSLRPLAMAQWAGTDLVLLGYAAGWVLVPLAAAGLVAVSVRPRMRHEQAFGILTAALLGCLLLEAALYAANGSPRFQERYLIVLTPLVPLLACVGARRLGSRPALLGVALVAAGMFLLAVRLPLSGYTALNGKQDSPFLQAISQLEERLGAGSAGLAVALAAGVLAAVAVVIAMRPRGVIVALMLTLVTLALASAGAVAYDIERSGFARDVFVGADARWIDAHGLDHVAGVLTPGSLQPAVSERLFWNRSLSSLLRLPGADPPDEFGSTDVRIRPDGTLTARGRTVQASGLLFDEYFSRVQLDGATLLESTAGASLWHAGSSARVAWMLEGRYLDGWLAATNQLTIWPAGDRPRRGTLYLRLRLPSGAPAQRLQLRAAGDERSLTLEPGQTRSVSVRVVAKRPWRLVLVPRSPFVISGGRFVGVILDAPRFVEQQPNQA
jgi:hypothetical protein